MLGNSMKENILRCVNNLIIIDRKRILFSIICTVLLWSGLVELFGNDFPENMIIRNWFIADLLLCFFCGVKINVTPKIEGYWAFLILLIAPGISFLSVEMGVENPMLDMQFLVVVLNYLIYISIYLILYFFTNRIKISIIIGNILLCFYALANSFVNEFRGNSIRVSDIFAVKTAMNVVGEYELSFTEPRVIIILMNIAVCLLALHLDYKEKICRGKIIQRIWIGIICFSMNVTVFNRTFINEHELQPYIWELKESAEDHGSLLDFTVGVLNLEVEKPKNYSRKKVECIEDKGAEAYQAENTIQTDQNPDIIVIMNESFSDLEKFSALQLDSECLTEFKAMEENVVKGNLTVPVFGGLTANTEFEFLTGFSNAFLPSGLIAFQNYVKADTYNLGRYLEKKGYYSLFMHPYYKDGWNRKNVYPLMGFDETIYLEDYHNVECLRGYISDSSNYQEVIERYQKAKEINEKVFLFNVTMQNHGGYETNEIEKAVGILNPKGSYPKAQEYLSLVKESDKAFKCLIDYFSQEEDPVIICMFGDHLPVVEEELLETLLESGNGTELEKNIAKYQTPFIIYANYDIEEKVYENISANYLQTILLETAGIPLNKYQKYLRELSEKYPVVSKFGVKDGKGNWYTWEEALELKEIQEYSMVQYRRLFD